MFIDSATSKPVTVDPTSLIPTDPSNPSSIDIQYLDEDCVRVVDKSTVVPG